MTMTSQQKNLVRNRRAQILNNTRGESKARRRKILAYVTKQDELILQDLYLQYSEYERNCLFNNFRRS